MGEEEENILPGFSAISQKRPRRGGQRGRGGARQKFPELLAEGDSE